MSVIAITGASGFIGGALVKYFLDKGDEVIALSRTAIEASHKRLHYLKYELESEPDYSALERTDVIIHCAFSKWTEINNRSDEININATLKLAQFCEDRNKKFIFLSSFSAHENALSHYGKHKFELEKRLADKHLVIKPGMVIGDAGMFAALVKIIETKKIIPVIGKGDQPMQWIQIEELSEAIGQAISKNLKGIFPLASAESITYLQLLEVIAEKRNRSPYFVFVHPAVAKLLLNVAGKKLPFTKENLLGLLQLKKFDSSASLERVGIRVKGINDSSETDRFR